jgi:hypothetical protein
MWDRVEDRLALLELLTTGSLKRRASQKGAFRWLAELSWTRASSRRDEITLVAALRSELVALIDRVWPDWRDEHLALLEAGEPATSSGWARLADLRRAQTLPATPERMNRRSAAAITAPGAKSTLTASRRAALGGTEVVADGLVRLRPPAGMRARHGGTVLSLDDVVDVFGEVALSDRALLDGSRLEGSVRAVLLVENLGPWRDLPQPDGWLLVHTPGWNTATVLRLLDTLPPLPSLHFGDLDPNGVRIYRHLAEHVCGLGWFVPEFWRELVPMFGRPCVWPEGLDLEDAPALVRELAAGGLWMEQEGVVLDGRVGVEMEGALVSAVAGALAS